MAVAQLNAAILFDKYNIIPDSNRLLLSQIVTNDIEVNLTKPFNINKHLAFKYYSMASL